MSSAEAAGLRNLADTTCRIDRLEKELGAFDGMPVLVLGITYREGSQS